MIIAGIDPGSNVTGYAFLEKKKDNWQVLEYGAIRTLQKNTLPKKLFKIHNCLSELFTHYQPQSMALETAFVAKYPQAALVLGHTRGAIMIAAQTNKIEVFEYEPRLIKQVITGVGRATKAQVAFMVQKRLRLKEMPQPADASDAVAVAYCHATSNRCRF